MNEARFGKLKYALNGVYSGGTPTAGNDLFYASNGVPFVTIGDMSKGVPIRSTERRVTQAGIRDKNLRVLRPGTVVVSMYATIGLPNILDIYATISQAILALFPRREVDHGFLYYWLLHVRDQLMSDVAGSTQGNLNAEKIKNISFPFLDRTCQRRIVDFLNRQTARLDEVIALKRRSKELLRERLSSRLESLTFRHKKSGEWPRVPFKWICHIPRGQVDPTQGEWGDLPLVAPNHIEPGTGVILALETAREQQVISGKYAFPRGAVLYSKIRPALAKACVPPVAGLCSADMYPIIPNHTLLPEYLLMQLLSSEFTDWAKLESMRVAMPKINRESLGAFRLVVPPVPIQRELVRIWRTEQSQYRHLRVLLDSSIAKLQELRSALITRVVKGHIGSSKLSNSKYWDRMHRNQKFAR